MAENNEKIIAAFVCTGNTCRSPMAEMLLKHALENEEAPLRRFIQVISLGVFAIDGDSANINALKALNSVEIDLSDHKSQRLTQEIVEKVDYVFCMTSAHKHIIENDFQLQGVHIELMGKYLAHPDDIDIPDPYGQDLDSYKTCRDNMVEAIPGIIKFLKRELGRQGKL